MSKYLFHATLLLSLLLWTSGSVHAQNTGLITGSITDQSGAVIPNATITIIQKATGVERHITANAEGIYSAPSLQAGDYDVRVEVQGFRSFVRPATVEAGTNPTVNVALLALVIVAD